MVGDKVYLVIAETEGMADPYGAFVERKDAYKRKSELELSDKLQGKEREIFVYSFIIQ
jgi:hypothetical protein